MKLLLGPVTREFADRYLHGPRAAGDWLAFGPNADLVVAPADTWADVAARFPAGWAPDAVVLRLPYASVPRSVWAAPVPVIGLAADWTLNWHAYRHVLPLCDAVLTDGPGVEALRRAGITRAHPAHLYGLGREYRDEWDAPDGLRDIDLVFVGNLHPAVQRDRLGWVGRAGGLADRHRVVVASGVFGADYRALLRRAKLAFNHSARGECNLRALEAAACGAVLLQEAGNAEVPRYLEPHAEYVPYPAADFEAVVGRLLADEPGRRAVAARARERVQGYTFDRLLAAALGGLDRGDLHRRAVARAAAPPAVPLAGRVWQRLALSATDFDPGLAADARAAGDAASVGALARASDPASAESALRRAAVGNRVSALALADLLASTGRPAEAAAEARQALADLDASGLTPAECDTPPGPGFDLPRVEWERAGWNHAGDPAGEAAAKTDLLRWRAHATLAGATDALTHYHEAVRHRPDLPAARAALGCAVARAGDPAAAVPHLRAAVAGNPFDTNAARACYQALWDAGQAVAARRLARERRVLHVAAPGLVPAEDWFAGSGPPVVEPRGDAGAARVVEHHPTDSGPTVLEWVGTEPGPAPPDPVGPVGDELASVIVPCWNEVGYTRLCLDSVLAHTRKPFELVVIDNGSTDDTPAYLADVAGRAGPDRVVVIRNEANRGFAAAVNQGLAAARGEFLVLLNNDTVVPPGWLDPLVEALVRGYPDGVGLAGPVSNYAPPPQHCPPGYTDPADLPAFARRHRLAAGRAEPDVPRLTGFCLAAARWAADRLGPLDEGYGVGFFEDDDWCARARRLGVRMRVVPRAYVHHFGSRTFAGQGVDTEGQLSANFERFREKWGAAEAAPYRRAAPPRRPARVSLTMIVKNEEHNLPACLGGLRDLFHEIVVADTGSADRTREAAAALGARVVEFPWVDSFAAARNAALAAATGDYAFWLDADDRVDDANRQKLRALFAALDGSNAAYVMKCRCVPDRPGGAATVVDHVRLFPVRPDVRWEFRVHEQVLPALRAVGADVRWADVVIDHVGYTDPGLRRKKLERDLRLLALERSDRPGHPFTLFNLGSVYQELGDDAAALDCLTKSLAASHPRDSIVRKLYALIAQCHRRLGDARAAAAAVADGRGHYPDDAELLFLDGTLRREAGDTAGAEAAFRRLLAGGEGEHFASVDDSLRGAKARHALGLTLRAAGRTTEAAAEWRGAVATDPAFAPGWLELGELGLAAGDDRLVGEAAAGLDPLAPAGAAALRARRSIDRGEFAAARGVLAPAIDRHPEDVHLRVVWSHTWLKAGGNDAEAERALRAVLALDPDHPEARHNLAVLLADRAAADAAAAEPVRV